MPAPVERELLTKAILAALRTITGLGSEVGRPPLPAPGKDAPDLPYVVLYPLLADGFVGPAQLPEADASLPYQTTTVGATGEQVEFNADRVRRSLLGRDASGAWLVAIAPVGLTVMMRRGLGAGHLEPDPPLMSIPERFVFDVTTS